MPKAEGKMTKEQEIQRIVRQIVKGYEPVKVILFGSYAYGQATEDSDIDLLIIKETSERFIDRWVMVQELIADPERRIPVEPIVVTPDELNRRLTRGDQFFQEIVSRGKVLYAA